MLVGRVVDDQVDDDADAECARLVRELDEIAQVTVSRVDAVVVADVVAVVTARRDEERVKPDARHAESSQVGEPSRQPREIADPVAIAVLERLDVERI